MISSYFDYNVMTIGARVERYMYLYDRDEEMCWIPSHAGPAKPGGCFDKIFIWWHVQHAISAHATWFLYLHSSKLKICDRGANSIAPCNTTMVERTGAPFSILLRLIESYTWATRHLLVVPSRGCTRIKLSKTTRHLNQTQYML